MLALVLDMALGIHQPRRPARLLLQSELGWPWRLGPLGRRGERGSHFREQPPILRPSEIYTRRHLLPSAEQGCLSASITPGEVHLRQLALSAHACRHQSAGSCSEDKPC